MDMREIQKQLIRMRGALNKFNDETGGCRTREADDAFYDAWGALTVLEQETRTPVAAA